MFVSGKIPAGLAPNHQPYSEVLN